MFSNNQTLNGLDNIDDLDVYSINTEIIDSNNYLVNGVQLNTSHIPENTNLYFTNQRAITALQPTIDNINININDKISRQGDTMNQNASLLVDNIDKTNNSTTLNIGASSTNINIGCGSNIQIVNIGANNSLGQTTINLGGTNDIVNIQGTLNSIQTTNTEVYDKNITLNKGSLLNQSARGAGISIRDNNNDNQGYIIVDETDGQGYNFKAPENTGIVRIRPSTGLTSDVILNNVAQTITADKTFQNSVIKFNNVNGRKVVCWEDAANEHQMLGLKVNPGLLGYQVSTTGTAHAWFAGVNSTTSNQLMRLLGNGNLIVGTSTTTTEKLLVEGITRMNGRLYFNNLIQNRVIELFRSTDNDNQYYGFGINPSILRYQIASSTNHAHVFYAGVNATTSNQLMRINGEGRVIIGTSSTTNEKLLVEGTTKINDSMTLLSSLNVSGLTILNNNVSINSFLNISGSTIINGSSTLLNTLNISGSTLIRGDLIVSGSTNLNINNLSSLNVSSTTTLHGPVTAMSSLNISGLTILNNNVSINSSLNVSGITKLLKIDAPDVDPTTGDGERELIIGDTNCNTLYLNCGRNGNKVINIGTANTNQSSINIGNLDRNSLIFIEGTINMKGNIYSTNVIHSDLVISNKNIYLNKNGTYNSLGQAGLYFEENGQNVGSLLIGNDRNSYRFKAPYYPQECIIEFDNNGANFTINKTKIDKIHDILTLGTSNGLSLNNQELSLSLSGVSSTGALHYTDFTKFNSLESSKWTQSGNNIYNKNIGYHVGIGTSNPQYSLDVQGGDININSSYNYKIDGVNVLNSTTLGSGIINSSLTSVGNLNNLTVNGSSTLLSDLNVSGNTVLNNNTTINGASTILSSLNVSGITTLNNNTLIQINGTFPNLITLKNNSGSSVLNYESLTYTVTTGIAHGANFYVNGALAGDYFIRNNSRGIIFGDQFATTMKIDNSNRRAGINTTNPAYTLHVSGDTNLSNSFVYRISGISVLSSNTLGSGIINSSLTSVGNLNNLLVTGHTTLLSNLTVNGDVNIDSQTLRVDSINNRVRIGSTNQPLNNQFEIYNVNTPNLSLNHDNAVFYNLTGNATQLSLLSNVPGNISLTKRFAYLSGGVEKLSIDGPTGNLNISNNSNYQISGLTVLSNNSLGSGVINSSLKTTGILDNLTVTSHTTLYSNLNVSGITTLNNNAIINGITTLLSSLNVSGLATINNGIINGSTTILSILTVSGSSILNNGLTVSGNSTFRGTGYFTSSLTSDGGFIANNSPYLQNRGGHSSQIIGNEFGFYIQAWNTSTLINDKPIILCGRNTGSPTLNAYVPSQSVLIGSAAIPAYKLDVLGDTNIQENAVYRISGISVLSSNTLGSGIIFSDLQKVGTLNTLDISGNCTMNSSLYVSGTVNLSSSSSYQISNVSVLSYGELGSTINKSSLQSVGILDNLTITGNTTLYSSLNVSGNSTFNNVSVNGNLIVFGTLINNVSVTNLSTFFVSGNSTFQGSTTCLSSFNVSGLTTLNNTTINGEATLISTLNISGNTNITNNLTITGSSLLRNNVTCLSNLNVNAPLFVTGVSSLQDYLQILGTTDTDYNSFIRINNANIINNSYRIRNPSNNNLYISRERNGMVTDFIECTYSDNMFLRVPTTAINIFQINAQTYGLNSVLRFFNASQVSQQTWDITVTAANDFIIGKNNALQYYIRCLNTNNIYLERNTTIYANLTVAANNILYYAPPVGAGVQYLIWNFNTNAIETVGSDERLKKNIKKLKSDESEFIYKIKVFKYQSKDEKTDGHYMIGPVAQQIEETPNNGIVNEFNNYKTVDDRSVNYAHLQETQKLKKVIDKQQKRILTLEKEVNELKTQINEIFNLLKNK